MDIGHKFARYDMYLMPYVDICILTYHLDISPFMWFIDLALSNSPSMWYHYSHVCHGPFCFAIDVTVIVGTSRGEANCKLTLVHCLKEI